MNQARLSGFLLVLMLLVQAGCSPPGILYLKPGRYLQPVALNEKSAQISLQRFTESFRRNENVGSHLIGRHVQALRVKPGQLSDALDTMLGDALVQDNVSFKRGSGWDRDLAGLQSYKGRAALVFGGEITEFSIKITTGVTRLTSNIDISMDVDCLTGLVDEEKIIRKTVRMNKTMLRFSADQKEIEKVIDVFLADIVEQIYKNYAEYVDQAV
jgi:hypothetical protein